MTCSINRTSPQTQVKPRSQAIYRSAPGSENPFPQAIFNYSILEAPGTCYRPDNCTYSSDAKLIIQLSNFFHKDLTFNGMCRQPWCLLGFTAVKSSIVVSSKRTYNFSVEIHHQSSGSFEPGFLRLTRIKSQPILSGIGLIYMMERRCLYGGHQYHHQPVQECFRWAD